MDITIRHRISMDVLRKEPHSISKFGIVAEEANKILNRHGYEIINIAPEGSRWVEMSYIDVVTKDLYDKPSEFPLELQIGLQQVDSMIIEIDEETVTRCEHSEEDIDSEFEYQTYGWAEELLNMWGLAARSANISLKQLRIAISSVAGIVGGATIQCIRNNTSAPKLEAIPVKNLEHFMITCEALDAEGIEVINLVINKPIPRTKTVTTLSYPLTVTKYVNMKTRE